MRKFLVALAMAGTLAAPATALPSHTFAQQSTRQDGLVNVSAADVLDVQNVNIGAVAGVVASVCPAVSANVAALATQVDQTGTSQTITCPTTGQAITIAQNNPGGQGGQDRTPPGRTQQDGLVNVFAADLIDVRDVNVAAAVDIIASVCPGVAANVTALASQVDQSGTEQSVTCPTTGQPIAISQNNPGRGR